MADDDDADDGDDECEYPQSVRRPNQETQVSHVSSQSPCANIPISMKSQFRARVRARGTVRARVDLMPMTTLRVDGFGYAESTDMNALRVLWI